MDTTHVCGGTILSGYDGPAGRSHRYCDRCGAFTRNDDEPFPTGTDMTQNTRAWDAGRECSPDAPTRTGADK